MQRADRLNRAGGGVYDPGSKNRMRRGSVHTHQKLRPRPAVEQLSQPSSWTVQIASSAPAALVQALRPKQWIKNLLLFAGFVFTPNLQHGSAATTLILGFIAFCALSSAGYLWNDVLDVEADRLHPAKKLRPIASGRLPIPIAGIAAVLLSTAGLALALWLRPSFAMIGGLYLLVTLSYSLWLKHMLLIDIFGIAAGFVLRAVAGAVVIGVPVSAWLYVCTLLGSLFIALGKRRNELELLTSVASEHRRNLQQYSIEFVDHLMIVVASAIVMAYSLYTFSAENLPRDQSMMLTIPFVLYGVFRYLFLIRVTGQGGAPEDLLLNDRGLLATGLSWSVVTVLLLYAVPR